MCIRASDVRWKDGIPADLFAALNPKPCRWAGITNYIVAAWDARSLDACMAMQLPCFNASAYTPIPLTGGREGKNLC